MPTHADTPSSTDLYRVQCVFRDNLASAVTCLLVGFVVIGASYAVRFPGQMTPALTAAGAALAMAGLRWRLARRPLPLHLAAPMAQGLVLLTLACLCLTLAVTGRGVETLHLGLLIIGCGLLFISWPCLLVSLTMVLGGWLGTVWLAQVPVWRTHYPHALAECVILAVLAMTIRRAAVGRQVTAMQAEQAQRQDTAQLAQRLTRSEQQYRDLFHRMPNGFAMQELIFDASGRACDARILAVNDHFVQMIGRPRASVVGRRVSEVFDEPTPSWIDKAVRVVATSKADRFELHLSRTACTFDVVAYAVDAQRFVLLMTDVTQRCQQEQALRDSEAHFRAVAESNRRLLSEVNHRVRNNLASLAGLLTLVQRQAGGVDQYHAAIDQRITAMTHVHNLLADANWGDILLTDLVTKLLASMQRSAPRQIAIRVHGPRVLIIPRQIPPLTMTLAELFNNSCKYGAHRAAGGGIDVTWATQVVGERGQVVLRWREYGGPPIEGAPRRSLGMELIEGFVSFELGGAAVLRFERQGVDHLIEFPISRQAHPAWQIDPAADTMMSS